MPNQKEAYQSLASTISVPIFGQPWWLNAVCGEQGWDAVILQRADGRITAALPHSTKRSKGIKAVTMPPLTPRLAPYLSYEINQKPATKANHQAKLLLQLIKPLTISHQYIHVMMPPDIPHVNWKEIGLRTAHRHTYTLDIAAIQEVYELMEPRARTAIRKAQKQVTIQQLHDISTLMRLLDLTFRKQGIRNPIQKHTITNIISALQARDRLMLYQAIDDQGRVHACNLTAIDDHAAYNLITASDPALHQSGAVSLLLWHAMDLAAQRRVSTYDFEGGMITPIAKLYQSFGAMRVPYLSVHGTGSRFWDALLTLYGRF